MAYKKEVLCAHSAFSWNTIRSHFSRREKKVYNPLHIMWLYKKRRKEKTTWKKGEKATTTTAPGLCTLTVVCLYIHSREWSAIMEHTMHVCVPLLCLLFLGEEKKETFCYWSIVSGILSCVEPRKAPTLCCSV